MQFRNNLAYTLILLGEYDKAVEHANEGLRLSDSPVAVLYSNKAWALSALGRYPEAKAVIAEAHARNVDYFVMRMNLFAIAFTEGDRDGMRRQLDWARDKPVADALNIVDHQASLFEGRRAPDKVAATGATDSVALEALAATYAALGDCALADRTLAKVSPEARPSWWGGVPDGLCGNGSKAERVAAIIAASPDAKALHNRAIGLPLIGALVAIKRGKYADARQKLEPSRPFEFSYINQFWTIYATGLSYLADRQAAEAMREFDKILTHRSISPVSVLYPLAHLGVARAAALAGDVSVSRAAYEALFALWKDADPDLPALVQARQEVREVEVACAPRDLRDWRRNHSEPLP